MYIAASEISFENLSHILPATAKRVEHKKNSLSSSPPFINSNQDAYFIKISNLSSKHTQILIPALDRTSAVKLLAGGSELDASLVSHDDVDDEESGGGKNIKKQKSLQKSSIRENNKSVDNKFFEKNKFLDSQADVNTQTCTRKKEDKKGSDIGVSGTEISLTEVSETNVSLIQAEDKLGIDESSEKFSENIFLKRSLSIMYVTVNYLDPPRRENKTQMGTEFSKSEHSKNSPQKSPTKTSQTVLVHEKETSKKSEYEAVK